MSLEASIGMGIDHNPFEAGYAAGISAKNQLGGDNADVVIVFSSVKYNQEQILKGVRSVFKDILMVGCSTAGEITTEGPSQRHSVSLMAVRSSQINFFAGVGKEIKKKGARKAGQMMARDIVKQAKKKLKSCIIFPDVLAGSGSDSVQGVLDILGKHFPLVGGASGDDFKFEQTYQYLNENIFSGAIVGLGLTGKFKFGIGVKHGWVPIGAPMKVTKSKGAIVYKVDDKPAINIYNEYFGEDRARELKNTTLAKLAITYPLGMQTGDSDELLIRDPISVDNNGAITCAADIPEGAEIRLMIGSRQEAVKVARIAAKDALNALEGSKPKAAIIFNCIARNKLFGERAADEIDAIQEIIGKNTPLLGFYTYGEQAPINGIVNNIKQCNTKFHNETVVIYLLAE